MPSLANERSPPSNNRPACKFCFAGRLQCFTVSQSSLSLLERNRIQLSTETSVNTEGAQTVLLQAGKKSLVFKVDHVQVCCVMSHRKYRHSTAACKPPSFHLSLQHQVARSVFDCLDIKCKRATSRLFYQVQRGATLFTSSNRE